MKEYSVSMDTGWIVQDTVKRFTKWLEAAEEVEIEKKLKTIGYVKQKQGQWLPPDDNYRAIAYRKCSECGKNEYLAKWMHYCPNCGAKMNLDGANETN